MNLLVRISRSTGQLIVTIVQFKSQNQVFEFKTRKCLPRHLRLSNLNALSMIRILRVWGIMDTAHQGVFLIDGIE